MLVWGSIPPLQYLGPCGDSPRYVQVTAHPRGPSDMLRFLLHLATLALSIRIAQKPYVIGPWGAKALKYESLEGKDSHCHNSCCQPNLCCYGSPSRTTTELSRSCSSFCLAVWCSLTVHSHD